MNPQQNPLTFEQIEQLNQISDPIARRRFGILFQLPQDLQAAFESDVTTNNVWSIVKNKYNLPETSVSAVARIIGLIFLGELPIKNFIAEIKNKLNVDVAKASAIAQDINLAIFQPVRQSLMKVHNITERGSTPINTQINADVNPPRPVQQSNYNAQRRRDDVLNKIRPAQQGSAGQATARPASYVKLRNTVDLRNTKKKNNKYKGFFT